MSFPLEPNRALIMPHAWDVGFLIFAGSVMGFYVVYGIWQLLRHKEPLMLMLLLGGLFGEMLEPICNVLGMAYHPENGQIIGFTTFGRHIPLWLVLCYPWYFGAFSKSIIDADARGELTSSRYWKTFGVAVLFAFLIETGPVQYVLWDYYGEQPMALFSRAGITHGMPIMWYIVNPTTIIATAAFTALVVRHRKGWHRWPVLVTMPISIVGFHTGAFAPVYVSENAGWTANQSILTAVISTIFCLVLLKTFERLLLGDAAARARQH